MKTFEVWVPNLGQQKKIAGIQADYFMIDSGSISFFQSRRLNADVVVGCVLVRGEFTVADTEFLLASPAPGELFAPLDAAKEAAARFAAEVEPEYCNAGPTPPRRRKSKGSTLGLD